MGRMYQEQIVFQETGGTHGVALATPEGAFLLAEDVGRHNAMDKVIGRALFQRRDLSRMVALLSGRISFEMALKAIRARHSYSRRGVSPHFPGPKPGPGM